MLSPARVDGKTPAEDCPGNLFLFDFAPGNTSFHPGTWPGMHPRELGPPFAHSSIHVAMGRAIA
eukprot:4061358-Alexandrium_andersonii.AAC.1